MYIYTLTHWQDSMCVLKVKEKQSCGCPLLIALLVLLTDNAIQKTGAAHRQASEYSR